MTATIVMMSAASVQEKSRSKNSMIFSLVAKKQYQRKYSRQLKRSLRQQQSAKAQRKRLTPLKHQSKQNQEQKNEVLSPGPSPCEADVIPLHHVPLSHCSHSVRHSKNMLLVFRLTCSARKEARYTSQQWPHEARSFRAFF